MLVHLWPLDRCRWAAGAFPVLETEALKEFGASCHLMPWSLPVNGEGPVEYVLQRPIACGRAKNRLLVCAASQGRVSAASLAYCYAKSSLIPLMTEYGPQRFAQKQPLGGE